ncbi:hypothetical protein CH302_02760 [Rhodococcus sp. 15-2388-1-1a]|uniref:hypothetical protein n=1 Tax=Nocardiaceae TaxID=85025 RepID=UPI00055B1B11|nr:MULTISPECIES: hypothetical protein [Rhodococcus]OZF04342.1 hypothetical protein CH302_02760 [Rhodococcus sp. 15-2388-1-1a]
MKVLRVHETLGDSDTYGGIDAGDAFLPHRDSRVKGPANVVPATAFWLTRARMVDVPAPTSLGSHAVVVLSGEVRVDVRDRSPAVLTAGDLVFANVASPETLTMTWDGFAWLLYLALDDWLPEAGDNEARPDPAIRQGRPSLTWIYDDGGTSRTEPLRWPSDLAPVPPVEQWPRSLGAFVTRRDYGEDGYVPGVWHNGPRPQLGVTLNGRAENETGDGTVTSPVAGDIAYIDDVTGAGHVTRGLGDRWMLFVTVDPEHLRFVPEK